MTIEWKWKRTMQPEIQLSLFLPLISLNWPKSQLSVLRFIVVMLSQQIVSVSREKRVLRADRDTYAFIASRPRWANTFQTQTDSKMVVSVQTLNTKLLENSKCSWQSTKLSFGSSIYGWWRCLNSSQVKHKLIVNRTRLSRSFIWNTIDLNKLMWNRCETGLFWWKLKRHPVHFDGTCLSAGA